MLIKSQKFQRLAETLLRVRQMVEGEGGETLEGARERLDEAREGLDEALQAVGVDLAVARLVDPETLARTLEGDAGKLWGVAESLYLDGVLARAEGRGERAGDRLRKARVLFGRLEAGLELPEVAASPEERLREIDERLR